MLFSVGSSRERVYSRTIFADPIYLPAVELNDALIAAADIEDVGKAAVLLFQRDKLIGMHGLACAGWPKDEHDSNTVHIDVLKERSPRTRFEDVEVFRIEVF